MNICSGQGSYHGDDSRSWHRGYTIGHYCDAEWLAQIYFTACVSTTVAQHAGDIPAGTLRAIERDLEPAFGKGWLR